MIHIEDILSSGKYTFIKKFLSDNGIVVEKEKWVNYTSALNILKITGKIVDKNKYLEKTHRELLDEILETRPDYNGIDKLRAELIFEIIYPSSASIIELPD